VNDPFDSVDCIASTLLPFLATLLPVSATMFERNFVLSTMSKQIEHVQFLSTLSKGRNFVRHCCRVWQQSQMLLRQSRTLLRHCCWCGRGLRREAQLSPMNARRFLSTCCKQRRALQCRKLVPTPYAVRRIIRKKSATFAVRDSFPDGSSLPFVLEMTDSPYDTV